MNPAGWAAGRIARAVAARPRLVLVAALALTVAAAVAGSRLGVDVDPVDLLPDHAPVAAAYRIALEHFGGLERVFVLLEGDDGVDLDAAQEELAERLRGQPDVAAVRVGLEPRDEAFLFEEVLPRAPLLVAGDEWRAELAARLTPEALRARAHALRAELLAPAGQLRAPWLAADPLGLAPLLPGLRPAAAIPIDPATGAFRSTDGRAALVVVTPSRGEMDAAGGRALLALLDAVFVELRAAHGTGLELSAVGGPLYAAQDERLIRDDLSTTVTSSALMCALVLIVASGGWRPPAGGFLAVAVGLVWTAAALAVGLGRVSAVGLAFAAVLVGLGLDYWIHGSARFARLASEGQEPDLALVATFRGVGPGILASAATTAAGFAVLAAAHLRPIREVGLAVAIGMTAILAATASVGAALLVLQAQRRRPSWEGAGWRALGRLVEAVVAFAERRSRLVLGIAALLTLVAVAGLPLLELQPDLRGLRPANHPVMKAERRLLERFDLGLDTTRVVVHGRTLDEALDRCAGVTSVLRGELGAEGSVTSPDAWLPEAVESRRRLAVLEELGLVPALDRFEAELEAAGLRTVSFAPALGLLRGLVDGSVAPAPVPATWPSWLGELIRVEPDGVWAAVHVRLPVGRWPEGPPAEIMAALEAAAPGVAVASAPAVGAELKRIAGADLERLAEVAFAVIVGVVLLSFRGRWRPALLSVTPVVLGTVWTLGLWGLAGGRLDVLSLIFVPILLGIGIDDGLHAVHAARVSPSHQLHEAMLDTGRAMVLTTLTTVAGFASLGLSHLPSLRAGGLLVAAGVSACLVATVLVLPALGSTARLRGRRRDAEEG